MTEITLQQYYMGREARYGTELDDAKRAAAVETVRRVNWLIAAMESAGLSIEINRTTATPVSSGWRPALINISTRGAAPRSKHMTCQACDLYDPDGALDDWCMSEAGQAALEEIGLWLEHPAATKGWCHVQTVPPGSGRRVFYP